MSAGHNRGGSRMDDEKFEDKLSDTAKQVLGTKKLPHKFCPYCGHRNEARAENCENCGKDISWLRMPDSLPPSDNPPLPVENLPEQKEEFGWKGLIVVLLIIILLIAAVVILVWAASRNKSGSKSKGAFVVAGGSGPPCAGPCSGACGMSSPPCAAGQNCCCGECEPGGGCHRSRCTDPCGKGARAP